MSYLLWLGICQPTSKTDHKDHRMNEIRQRNNDAVISLFQLTMPYKPQQKQKGDREQRAHQEIFVFTELQLSAKI